RLMVYDEDRWLLCMLMQLLTEPGQLCISEITANSLGVERIEHTETMLAPGKGVMVWPIGRLWIFADHSAEGHPAVMISHDVMHWYVQSGDQAVKDLIGSLIITHGELAGFGFDFWRIVRAHQIAADDYERRLRVQPVHSFDYPHQRLNRIKIPHAHARSHNMRIGKMHKGQAVGHGVLPFQSTRSIQPPPTIRSSR